jgi:hypothetical protein
MQPLANERGGFDLRIDARRRHATSKLETPLPHDLLHPNPNHGGHDAGERVPRLLILPRTSSAKSCSLCGGSDGATLFTCEATLARAHGGQSLPGAQGPRQRAIAPAPAANAGYRYPTQVREGELLRTCGTQPTAEMLVATGQRRCSSRVCPRARALRM